MTYRSEGREHEKSGSLDWPENWSAFHELIEQLGFDDGVFDLCPVHIHELHVVMKESRVISYEEALDIAKSTDSGFNHCLEYEKAWFFWNTANDMSEGPVPYAVFKESGFAKWFGAYDQVNQSAGEFLKEFDIN